MAAKKRRATQSIRLPLTEIERARRLGGELFGGADINATQMIKGALDFALTAIERGVSISMAKGG